MGAPAAPTTTPTGVAGGYVSGPELSKITGLTYRQVDYWTSTGLLQPDGGNGSGSQRRFSALETAVAYRLAEATRGPAPLSLRTLREIAPQLRRRETVVVSNPEGTVLIQIAAP